MNWNASARTDPLLLIAECPLNGTTTTTTRIPGAAHECVSECLKMKIAYSIVNVSSKCETVTHFEVHTLARLRAFVYHDRVTQVVLLLYSSTRSFLKEDYSLSQRLLVLEAVVCSNCTGQCTETQT